MKKILLLLFLLPVIAFISCGTHSKRPPANPLIIVDGEVYERSIQTIDPEKVISITILKNHAAAKYGESGKNGVIVFEMKK